MISTAEALETALAPAAEAPKASQEGQRRQTCAHGRAEEGQGGEEGHPRQESAQGAKGAKKGRRRPRGQQTANVLDLLKRKGGATAEGTDEGHGLAGPQRAGIPLRNGRQEDGPGRHVHQGRGRRAQLLRQGLSLPVRITRAARFPPGGVAAASLAAFRSLGYFRGRASRRMCDQVRSTLPFRPRKGCGARSVHAINQGHARPGSNTSLRSARLRYGFEIHSSACQSAYARTIQGCRIARSNSFDAAISGSVPFTPRLPPALL